MSICMQACRCGGTSVKTHWTIKMVFKIKSKERNLTSTTQIGIMYGWLTQQHESPLNNGETENWESEISEICKRNQWCLAMLLFMTIG